VGAEILIAPTERTVFTGIFFVDRFEIPALRNKRVKTMFLRLADSMRTPSPLRGHPGICRQSHAGRGVPKPHVERLGVSKMKAKTRQVRVAVRRLSGNEQVRREIQSFLYALKSYPGRFARDPRVTFAEHHGGLVRAASTAARRRV
jgi:ribosomal protein L13E